MSDTPRTDAVELFARHMDTHREKDECRFQCMSLAPSSFARTLERELTAEQKRYDELRVILARETARGDRLEKALRDTEAFIVIMFSRGSDATMPETIPTPLGPSIKIGEIMRDVRAALGDTIGDSNG